MCFFLEYPNDSGYEGSGAPECYDDEDCDIEGSGSGDGPWDDEHDAWEGSGAGRQPPATINKEPESKWPPWETRGDAENEINNGSEDIDIDDSLGNSESTPQRGSGASSLALTSRTLLQFALPVLICWLGHCLA